MRLDLSDLAVDVSMLAPQLDLGCVGAILYYDPSMKPQPEIKSI